MYSSFSLKSKMLLPSIFLCLIALVVGAVGYSALAKVDAVYSVVVAEQIPSIVNADKMFLAFRSVRIGLRTLGLAGITKADELAAVQDAKDSVALYDKIALDYEKRALSAENAKIYENVKIEWANFKALGGRVLALQARGGDEDHKKMIDIFMKDCPESAAKFMAAIGSLVAFHEEEAAVSARAAAATRAWANNAIIISTAVGALAGLAAALLSITLLVKDISFVTVALIRDADAVDAVAGEITHTSEALSASSTEQAAAIQETTSSMEETSAMVGKNAENAERSQKIALRSQATAVRGQDAVRAVLVAIDEISLASSSLGSQVNQTNRELEDMVKMIQEIGTKTKVINDIVFQTKLLSFNASVEAARAGEQGKGFAVVAEEVGNLARMSGDSAKEITDLLELSTKRVEGMVSEAKARVTKLVAESESKVKTGSETARRCEEVLAQIVTDVGQVGQLVGEITVASAEQARGVAEVNKAIAELDTAAQSNSQASAQGSASAQTLAHQVIGVRHGIGTLQALVNGGPRSEEAAPAANPSNVHKLRAKKIGSSSRDDDRFSAA